MIVIEEDSKEEGIFIHATRIELSGLTKKLWVISEKADAKGKQKE